MPLRTLSSMLHDWLFSQLSKQKAVAVVCGLALLILFVDLLTPKELDVSVFYALSIAACAWTRSPRFLWLTIGVIILFIILDWNFGPPPLNSDHPHWMMVLDRLFDTCALLMLAAVVHFWIHSLQALEENQLLLAKQIDLSRELQHRVRNDLQVIYVFLDREARGTGDPDARRSLEVAGRQVMSLAQIYDHLVGAEMSTMIDFSAYLKSLCSGVGEFRTLQHPGVELICRVSGSVFLDLNTVTALGVVVNELVANAYEHGFPAADGKIEVSLLHEEGDGQVVLRIDDNGVGLPASAAENVGLRLVRRWVATVNGTIDVRVGDGTKWSITLPVPRRHGTTAPRRIASVAPAPANREAP